MIEHMDTWTTFLEERERGTGKERETERERERERERGGREGRGMRVSWQKTKLTDFAFEHNEESIREPVKIQGLKLETVTHFK